MAIIRKKTWPEIFELVKSGKKRFDVRAADFKLKEGDTLILEEWNPKTKKYTGRKMEKKVGYVLRYNLDKFGQKDLIEKHGLYVIQLEDLTDNREFSTPSSFTRRNSRITLSRPVEDLSSP